MGGSLWESILNVCKIALILQGKAREAVDTFLGDEILEFIELE